MASTTYEPESDLPPPGSRWGSGAQSVLPYLTKSLQARPAAADAREQRARDDTLPVRPERPHRPQR